MDARAPVRGISMVVADVEIAELPSRPAAGALDVRLIAAARAAARAQAQHDSLQPPGEQCMHAGHSVQLTAALNDVESRKTVPQGPSHDSCVSDA